MKRVFSLLITVMLISATADLYAQREGNRPAGNRPAAEAGQRGQSGPKAVSLKDGVATLSPENTKVNFVGKHNGEDPKPRLGGFKKFSGKLSMDESGETIEALVMEFETSSLWTELGGNLTDHLKNPDFLDVEKFPSAKFVSTNVVSSDKKGMLNIVGDFTLMGKTNEITIPVTLKKEAAGVMVNGEVILDRAEFGMNNMLDRVSKEVSITLAIGEKTAADTAVANRGRGQGGRGGFDVAAMFKNQDADKDGKLTGDEIPERMRSMLERIDTDKDGSITLKEMETMMQRRTQGGGRGAASEGQGRRPNSGDGQ
jgi:polyisoprenoid-binding protein YceI